MKKIIGLTFILAILFLASGCASPYSSQNSTANPPASSPSTQTQTPSTGQTQTISIKNFTFNPAVLNIKAGETVVWTNNDTAPHQIKSATFNSDVLNQGNTFSFTFSTAGSFDYSCAIHPSMTGKIVVTQ